MNQRNRVLLFVLAFAAAAAAVGYGQWGYWRAPGPSAPAPAPFALSVDGGVNQLVPASDILSAGPAPDAMPAIDHPSFVADAVADPYLKDDGLGIDVATAHGRRFYPFQILVWHLAVNDVIDGTPVLVAFCPLCQDGGAYERTVGGNVLQFGTAGQEWNSTSLLYDVGSKTVWTAATALALRGPMAGTRLTPVPSRIMTWADWKKEYPDGNVLARVSGSDRDYTLDPYGSYAVDRRILFPITRPDARLGVKDSVYGVSVGGADKAYAASDVQQANVVNDRIGATPVSVWTFDGDGAEAFEAQANGKTLTFFRAGDGSTADRETGSTWDDDGAAIAGPLRGSHLTRLPLERSFWYCWAGLHPQSMMYSSN